MYTVNERQAILEKLNSIISSIPNIEGLILVGSGSIGFTDEWSDIDLSVVVSPENDTQIVWEEVNKIVLKELNVYKHLLHQYGKDNYITVILLDNFLEIDIGVVSLNILYAKNERWKVLFDKSGKITETMKATWANRKLPDINAELQQSINFIWHHVKNAGFAIKRNKQYRVVKELEEIRNESVRLQALKENKEAKHFRDVDKMDKLFIDKLGKTFFKKVDINELTEAFTNLFELYFEVVKTIENNPEITNYESRLRIFLQDLKLL